MSTEDYQRTIDALLATRSELERNIRNIDKDLDFYYTLLNNPRDDSQ